MNTIGAHNPQTGHTTDVPVELMQKVDQPTFWRLVGFFGDVNREVRTADPKTTEDLIEVLNRFQDRFQEIEDLVEVVSKDDRNRWFLEVGIAGYQELAPV